jgi:hypothetical protein
MGAHDKEFAKAKEKLSSLQEDPGNDVKLKIYALFKQVLDFKCQGLALWRGRSSHSHYRRKYPHLPHHAKPSS